MLCSFDRCQTSEVVASEPHGHSQCARHQETYRKQKQILMNDDDDDGDDDGDDDDDDDDWFDDG